MTTNALEDAIDWSALLTKFGGREAFVRRLLSTMRHSHAEMSAELRAATERRDRKRIGFIAHTIKGSAGNLEAGPLRELASRTEAATRHGEEESFVLARQLADRLDALLALIDDTLAP